MAFDQAVAASFSNGSFRKRFGAGSCLWRWYGWQPSALTLGYNQPDTAIDYAACRRDGIDVVRRPTGGRAVLHADAFTYSFFCDAKASNEELYRMVHEVIDLALGGLGIQAGFCRSTLQRRDCLASSSASVSCFSSSARYELQALGRKLVGSAQRRSGTVLLQHGSLPLSRRHMMLGDYILHASADAGEAFREEMARKTVSLEEILGYIPEYSRIAGLMMQALAAHFGADPVILEPGAFAHHSFSSDETILRP